MVKIYFIICFPKIYFSLFLWFWFFQHQDCSNDRVRYLQCPAGVTVAQLKRLLRAKFGLSANHPLSVLASVDDNLHDSLTLVDIAYIKSWQRVCINIISCFIY